MAYTEKHMARCLCERFRRLGLALAMAVTGAGAGASPMVVTNTKGQVVMDLAVEWVNHPQSPIYSKSTWVPINEPSLEGETQPWQVRMQDKTLSQTLFRWAQTAGWQIQWDAERDHPIEASFQIEATFVQALKIVMESLIDSEYPLQAVLNPQTRSLRIVRHNESPRR